MKPEFSPIMYDTYGIKIRFTCNLGFEFVFVLAIKMSEQPLTGSPSHASIH